MKENMQEMKTKVSMNENIENKPVRKLLVSAALATAIISWIATAQGLDLYVFEHYWQAAVISGAIQGTLFAFSVNAIPLMKKLEVKGKIAMVFLWSALLMASSIFSYVYISKTVYSERLLKEDSNRILAKICLEKYIELEDILDFEKEEIEVQLEEYIALIAGGESGIVLSDDSKKTINQVIEELNDFEVKNITEVPDKIIINLEKMKEGKYSENDIKELNVIIKNENEEINKLIENLEREKEQKQQDIKEINDRLKTFSNVNSSQYQNLNVRLIEAENKRDELFEQIRNYSTYIGELENCRDCVDSIENTLEKTLYNEMLDLRICMNEEHLDTKEMQESAEKIYNALLDNNVSALDDRLLGYRKFRSNVDDYKTMMISKEIIENAIKTVYDYSTESNDAIEQWRNKLNEIQYISKNIPQEYYDIYSGKLTKSEIVSLVTSLDRLYLSDLNDFERAWSLLFNPIHSYKMLLIFSFVFSFGIDIFSFGTGMLLYFMKK